MSARDPSHPAEEGDHPTSGSSAGVRNLIALGAVVAVVAVAVGFSRLGADDETPPPMDPTAGPSDATAQSDRDSAAIDLLVDQERALSRGDRAGYLATWDSRGMTARREAATTYANLEALGVQRLRTRYVAANPTGLSVDERRRLGGEAWTAEVEVAWRLAGIDEGDARTVLTYTFAERGGRVVVVDLESAPGAQRPPIWVLGPLDVRRSERTLVAASNPGDARRIDRQLRTAVRDVEAVIPSWDGELVAYAPGDAEMFTSLVAAEPGTYDGIAAVTTTVDGSQADDAPVAIVVNPEVFGRLGPVGGHVVISHESTHVATEAATVSLPLWVAEGFADYVGVGAVDVPLSVSAGAALRVVRENGAPETLPEAGDFAATNPRLQASYELSWLAVRTLAEEYGEPRLLRFYRYLLDNPDDLAGAFERLGTTEAAFTAVWRTRLEELADAA